MKPGLSSEEIRTSMAAMLQKKNCGAIQAFVCNNLQDQCELHSLAARLTHNLSALGIQSQLQICSMY